MDESVTGQNPLIAEAFGDRASGSEPGSAAPLTDAPKAFGATTEGAFARRALGKLKMFRILLEPLTFILSPRQAERVRVRSCCSIELPGRENVSSATFCPSWRLVRAGGQVAIFTTAS